MQYKEAGEVEGVGEAKKNWSPQVAIRVYRHPAKAVSYACLPLL